MRLIKDEVEVTYSITNTWRPVLINGRPTGRAVFFFARYYKDDKAIPFPSDESRITLPAGTYIKIEIAEIMFGNTATVEIYARLDNEGKLFLIKGFDDRGFIKFRGQLGGGRCNNYAGSFYDFVQVKDEREIKEKTFNTGQYKRKIITVKGGENEPTEKS